MKGHEEKLREDELLRQQAAAAEAFKLQRFGGTLCRHRFSSRIFLTSVTRVGYQILRTDASYLW